ncbi:MAG TPA: mannonate dehydratase, partial [Dehalococcoidia bacterium]|nr:mannonate dehydratase [Dehalococcoidia bacterium]
MRAGFGQFNQATPEYLRFAQQYGVTDILLNTPQLPTAGGQWQLADLVKLRLSVEQHGMKLSALENVPSNFYDHIMLNGPKRDEQIDNMITTIRNMARAGIPIFGYHWMPSFVWRTPQVAVRGGAMSTAFDYEAVRELPLTHGRVYTRAEMWESLELWIKTIPPVAVEEGIRLGIHPCDPPVESLAGIPQLFSSYDDYRRCLDIVDSPCNAIEFCQGTFAEMADSTGDNIYGFIKEMVERDRVIYV